MIKVLLDQGLAPRAAALLAERGMNAVHVSEIGLAEAEDAEILQAARDSGRVCATLDHDFHTHLAVAGKGGPSVILLRVEGLRAEEQAEMIACSPPTRNVATCGYNMNMETGVRELKDNLSRYIRRIEAGERIVVTAHGRVVAELVPPAAGRHRRLSQLERLVASGVITPPVEDGDPLQDCPEIRLPPGTAAALIDSDRGET